MLPNLYNSDTGDLGGVSETDYFIIGMSKCGTSTLYHSLQTINSAVIKYHSDYTLTRVFGDVGITTKQIINTRKNIDRPFYVFTPYRNPIDRKVSQYYQYIVQNDSVLGIRKSDEVIIEEIKQFILGSYSCFHLHNPGFLTEVDENLVYKNIFDSIEINMFDYNFDKDRGFIQIVKDNLIFIPYTLLKIDSLAQFIRETIDPDFELILKRITGKNSQ